MEFVKLYLKISDKGMVWNVIDFNKVFVLTQLKQCHQRRVVAESACAPVARVDDGQYVLGTMPWFMIHTPLPNDQSNIATDHGEFMDKLVWWTRGAMQGNSTHPEE